MSTSSHAMNIKLGKQAVTSGSGSDSDDGWETPSYHKRKDKVPDENITAFIANMREDALELAAKHSDSIVSVLYSKHGKRISTGYSSWKEDCDVNESEVLQKLPKVSTVFNPSKGQFGTACAEVCALYFSTVGSNRGWSLAYDARHNHGQGRFIGACANCKKLLSAKGINDAITHIRMG